MFWWLCAIIRVQRWRSGVGGAPSEPPPSTVDSQAEICPFAVKSNEKLNTAGYYKVSWEEKVRGIDPPPGLILCSQTPPETWQQRPDHLLKVIAYMHVNTRVNPSLWARASKCCLVWAK